LLATIGGGASKNTKKNYDQSYHKRPYQGTAKIHFQLSIIERRRRPGGRISIYAGEVFMSVDIILQQIITKTGAKKQGAGWRGYCPSHKDKTPSLSITQAADGMILLNCFANCDNKAVCADLNITQADLFPPKQTQAQGKPKYTIDKIYDYRDEAGNLLFQAVRGRLANTAQFPNAPHKDFKQRQPDGNGGWIWNLKGVRRVLYRLPELIASDPGATVLVVEGEKDFDRLRSLGLIATCNPMGAGKWIDEYSDFLIGRDCVVIEDNDDPGRKQTQEVCQSLFGKARSLRKLSFQNLPEHGDVSDWLDAGGTEDELCQMDEAAPEWALAQVQQTNGATSSYACVRMSSVKPEKIEWLWKNYLAKGKITLLDGWPGIGKSWLTCMLAAIVSRGGGFPNGVAFKPGNVLMFSAEDGLNDTLWWRLDACGADLDKIIALNLSDNDGLADFSRNGLIRFENTIIEHNPLLVIVDPLFAFTGGAVDIHRANECREISRSLAAITIRQKCSLLTIRHLNKSGGNGDPMKAGIGSIDWLAAARVGLLAGCDPDDKSKLALTIYKSNVGRQGLSLGYRLTFNDQDEGKFEWVGESDLTAERILSPAHVENTDETSQRIDAEKFLRDLLENGPVDATEVEKARKANLIPEYQIRKAKIALGIKSYKLGNQKNNESKWLWELP